MSAILNSHDHGLAELTAKAAQAKQVQNILSFVPFALFQSSNSTTCLVKVKGHGKNALIS
jgi:hypothetical protein